MSLYRLHILDALGKVKSADSLDARNDEDAIVQAMGRQPHYRCELWQRERIVARIGAAPHKATSEKQPARGGTASKGLRRLHRTAALARTRARKQGPARPRT